MDALRIRFPKETQKSLLESYIEKEEHRAQRYDFLKNTEQETRRAQTSHMSLSNHVLDVRYRDLLSFASQSCRTGLMNKMRANPDILLNTNSLQQGTPVSQQDIEESKRHFQNYTRNVDNIRNNILQE